MLYGVFSDVHSNLEALERVLAFFEESRVEAYICCGDLVGYGPDPDACLERIRGLKSLSAICGNHDLAAIGRMDLAWFNPYARQAALWTGRRLSAASREYLEGLSARLEAPEFTLAHGTPRRPAEEYMLSGAQFKESFPLVRVWPLFIGHSHMPLCFRQGGDGAVESMILEEGRTVDLRSSSGHAVRAALNPGSVGQPRDQDCRASCALYDSEKATFRLVRLDYDIPAVQAKILAAGLPEFLAVRLSSGR